MRGKKVKMLRKIFRAAQMQSDEELDFRKLKEHYLTLPRKKRKEV